MDMRRSGALVALVLLAGCGTQPADPVGEAPDADGHITCATASPAPVEPAFEPFTVRGEGELRTPDISAWGEDPPELRGKDPDEALADIGRSEAFSQMGFEAMPGYARAEVGRDGEPYSVAFTERPDQDVLDRLATLPMDVEVRPAPFSADDMQPVMSALWEGPLGRATGTAGGSSSADLAAGTIEVELLLIEGLSPEAQALVCDLQAAADAAAARVGLDVARPVVRLRAETTPPESAITLGDGSTAVVGMKAGPTAGVGFEGTVVVTPGGCLGLDLGAGTGALPVVLPHGTTAAGDGVVLPDGHELAVGDTWSAGGTIAEPNDRVRALLPTACLDGVAEVAHL